MIIDVTVNGVPRHLKSRSGDRLVDMLRKELKLLSLSPDCLQGRCGKCLVFMDGRIVHSCLVPAFKARATTILTFEAIAKNPEVKDIEKAFQITQTHLAPFAEAPRSWRFSICCPDSLPGEEDYPGGLDMVSCPAAIP
jgi:aerobic-type carbon monoxide dehydrogenase small subunit (CoxS/CutS family)